MTQPQGAPDLSAFHVEDGTGGPPARAANGHNLSPNAVVADDDYYTPNSARLTTIGPFKLPSRPRFWIYAPSLIDFDIRMEIQSLATKIQQTIDPFSGRAKNEVIIDPSLIQRALVYWCVTQPGTQTNLEVKLGTGQTMPIKLSPEWVRREMDPDDAEALGEWLLAHVWNQVPLEAPPLTGSSLGVEQPQATPSGSETSSTQT